MEANNGFINAEIVAAAAEDSSSSLHDAFEWDDDVAAHQYRLTQARKILRSLRVVIEVEEAEEEEFELGRFIIDAGPKEMPYVRADIVAGNAALHQEAIERATRALKGIRDRYKEIHELDHIWSAISAI